MAHRPRTAVAGQDGPGATTVIHHHSEHPRLGWALRSGCFRHDRRHSARGRWQRCSRPASRGRHGRRRRPADCAAARRSGIRGSPAPRGPPRLRGAAAGRRTTGEPSASRAAGPRRSRRAWTGGLCHLSLRRSRRTASAARPMGYGARRQVPARRTGPGPRRQPRPRHLPGPPRPGGHVRGHVHRAGGDGVGPHRQRSRCPIPQPRCPRQRQPPPRSRPRQSRVRRPRVPQSPARRPRTWRRAWRRAWQRPGTASPRAAPPGNRRLRRPCRASGWWSVPRPRHDPIGFGRVHGHVPVRSPRTVSRGPRSWTGPLRRRRHAGPSGSTPCPPWRSA